MSDFQNSIDCVQNEIDLKPEKQELKILNEVGEYYLLNPLIKNFHLNIQERNFLM